MAVSVITVLLAEPHVQEKAGGFMILNEPDSLLLVVMQLHQYISSNS